MILIDASGLFAAIDADQPRHAATRAAIEADTGPLILSPFALCEVDYLVTTRLGRDTELALLADVERGAYEVPVFGAGDIATARRVIEAYADLDIGLADASIVVLAGRHGTNRVLTLDERHFRALRAPSGEPFVILPADA